MTFKHHVSLGNYCETAYQIRRRTGARQAHFFDWLVTPFAALMQVLETDFAGVFLRENLHPHDNAHTVIDTANGLLFHHDFTRNDQGEVTEETIDREYTVARAKVQFLQQRWRSVTRGEDRVLYVIVGNETPDDILRLQTLMRGKYPGHDFTLLWARRPGAPGFESDPEGIVQAVVPFGVAGPTEWQGDDAAWDAAFAAAEARIPAAAAAQ
jgi:hypothetical protein